MFEFLESKANDLIDSINSTANGMSSDSEAATTQATDNESQASQLEAQAAAEEASCPHYKEETRTVTVDDGEGKSHTETEKETVPDPAADASSRAKASSLRAQAATLKAAAAALRALASALRAQLDAIKAQRQRFADAIAEVNQKAEDAKQKLNEGTGFIVGAIRAFSVTIVSGAVNMVKNTTNSILGNVGIDLSDGFDEKDVYGLTGWIAQTAVDTGAFVVKTFVSTTVASTLGGGMIGTTGAFVVGKVVGPTIDEAFGEKAVDGVHTFLTSALEFFGIKAKPDEKETATAGTEEVETILKGDKADINPGSVESSKLSPEELAAEIWSGKWGNGVDRKAALKEAGYSDDEIKAAQGVINTVYLGNNGGSAENPGKIDPIPASKRVGMEELAREINSGKWGNGTERVNNLRAAGYSDIEINNAQRIVSGESKGTILNENAQNRGQQATEHYTRQLVNEYNANSKEILELKNAINEFYKEKPEYKSNPNLVLPQDMHQKIADLSNLKIRNNEIERIVGSEAILGE